MFKVGDRVKVKTYNGDQYGHVSDIMSYGKRNPIMLIIQFDGDSIYFSSAVCKPEDCELIARP